MRIGSIRQRTWKILSGRAGFSLVEVLVALGISSVVAWAILNLQINQSKSATVQAEIVAMQQGLRGSMTLVTRELKKAGYNPDIQAAVGVNTANQSLLYYTYYSESPPTPRVMVHSAFCFANNTLRFTEGNSNAVGNHATHAHLDVMTDIQAVEFRYQLADGSWTLTPGTPADIRLVEISLLGRTRTSDPNHKNTTVYKTASGANLGPYNDGFRRQMLTSTVKFWNMGS